MSYQEALMQIRGFCDGAGRRGMNPDYEPDKWYQKGYVDGQKATRGYSDRLYKFAKVRTQDEI